MRTLYTTSGVLAEISKRGDVFVQVVLGPDAVTWVQVNKADLKYRLRHEVGGTDVYADRQPDGSLYIGGH